MKVPLIDNYSKFVTLNDKLRLTALACITIKFVNYDFELIRAELNGEGVWYGLNEFLLDFVKLQNIYVAGGIEYFEPYDFAKLYSKTHPKKFKERLYDYAKDVMLLGEETFTVCGFNASVTNDNALEGESFGLEVNGFEDDSTAYLDIPYGITSVGYEAFSKFKNLGTIKFPATLKEIKGMSFSGCPHISTIIMPSSIASYIKNTVLFTPLKYEIVDE